MNAGEKERPFAVATTNEGQRECLRAYQGKIVAIMGRVPYKQGDARWAMLSNLIPPSVLYVTAINFRIYLPEYSESVIKMLDLVDRSQESIQAALDDYSATVKQAFVVNSQFQVENGLKNLLRALEPANTTDSFVRIAREILVVCKVSDLDLKHRVLYTPALIRNCLHSNGIHTRSSVTNVINGVEYKFEQGQRFTCGHLSQVVHALSASLDVIEEILLSDAARKPSIIVDAFDEQRERSGITP